MRGLLALSVGMLVAGALPAHAWMTFVARDVATGERLGRGAIQSNDDEDEQLAIICTPDGVTATFVPGLMLTSDMALKDFRGTLLVAADGGPYEPFVVTPERFARSDAAELRLRLGKVEAMELAELVLEAQSALAVSFQVRGEELVHVDYDNDSAPITIGSVLGECEGR